MNFTPRNNPTLINVVVPPAAPSAPGGVKSGQAPDNQVVLGVDLQGNLIYGPGSSQDPYQSKTSNYTILGVQTGTVFDNAGASAEVDFLLPGAVQGYKFTFIVVVAQTLKILPGANTSITIAGASSLPNGNIVANVPGASITLEAISNTVWMATATPDKSQWALN